MKWHWSSLSLPLGTTLRTLDYGIMQC